MTWFQVNFIFYFYFQIIEALQNKVEQSHDSDKVRIASEDTLRLIGLALQKRIKDEKYEIVHFPTNPENYLSFCDLTEVVLHPERKMWHTFVMQDQTDVLENLHGTIESVLKFPVWTTKAPTVTHDKTIGTLHIYAQPCTSTKSLGRKFCHV